MFLLRCFSLWVFLLLLEHRLHRVSGAMQPGIGGGKFSTRDGMRCTWSASDTGDAVNVRVDCEKSGAQRNGAVTETSCEYLGKPRSCPGYNSDPKAFWKQVARAFKRLQGKVCIDGSALVKTGMCKSAPRQAHLRLNPDSVKIGRTALTTPPPLQSSTAACLKGAGHRRGAEDYCGSSWASVCAFFMSIVQSEDC
ncbi:fibroblast growth factor-binding protein 1-like [Cyprinodon tularosa]|uniref:fibroblast growth factor-binding protein 1-like n=1 Tax=Cyprinodon tularosa TaxID=77115 RepID=UPI0018E26129|nr:fibroblast growth factor-binding protein 1-like [Cyprinodon tularosa]